MRIYTSCEEATIETERDLFELGVDVQVQSMQDKVVADDADYETKELSPHAFELVQGARRDKDFFLTYFEIPKAWAVGEFEERISHREINPGEAWKHRADVWEEYLHDGKFGYTYNERMLDVLPNVIKELKARPGSRQVILPIYDGFEDMNHWGGRRRIPCSLYYQFMIRPSQDPSEQGANRLNMIYAMRSNDFLTFFGSDNWFALTLQEYVARALGIGPGRYIYMAGSLHAYYKDLKKRNIF